MTIQRKVEVDRDLAGSVNVLVLRSHSSLPLTSCSGQMLSCKLSVCISNAHTVQLSNHSFLCLFFLLLQECGQKMTEKEVSITVLKHIMVYCDSFPPIDSIFLLKFQVLLCHCELIHNPNPNPISIFRSSFV